MTTPQGDLSLLESDTAQRLLASTIPARVAYTWADGTPRVVPIWFHWDGEELVMASVADAPKVAALQRNPTVAVTIDANEYPHDVLLVRGDAEVSMVDGVVPEYAAAAQRYFGEEGAEQWLSQLPDDARMARIGVRPSWVAVLDFQQRFPSAIGGVQG
jgi:PPOX class probable F420-dependent enzyme